MSPDEGMAILAIVFVLVPVVLTFSLFMWIQRLKSSVKVLWRPTDYTAQIVTKKPTTDGFVTFGDHAVALNPQGAAKKMPMPLSLKTRFGHMPFYKMSYKSSVPEGWSDAEKTEITGEELKALHEVQVLKAIAQSPKQSMTLLILGIVIGAAFGGLGLYAMVSSGAITLPSLSGTSPSSQNIVNEIEMPVNNLQPNKNI
jgi:hypothetical protein